MKFDSKQKVLLAIYTEYQKDLPNMRENIKADKLGLENDVFFTALEKLENEGLITDVQIIRGGGKLIMVMTDSMKMTKEGIEYVEEKIGIRHTLTGAEKIAYIVKESASWGWDQIKDIASRTLSEMAKEQ